MTASDLMQNAIFDKLVDLRKEVKELLQDVPDVADCKIIDKVYINNMTVYACLDKIDKHIREVMQC